jgi:hypothetical protein
MRIKGRNKGNGTKIGLPIFTVKETPIVWKTSTPAARLSSLQVPHPLSIRNISGTFPNHSEHVPGRSERVLDCFGPVWNGFIQVWNRFVPVSDGLIQVSDRLIQVSGGFIPGQTSERPENGFIFAGHTAVAVYP